MQYLSSLKNKNLSGKTCLLRVDLNIENADLPSGRQGLTLIPLRMERILSTIIFLLDRGAKIVILSHRGRPPRASLEFSLKPFVKILSSLLKRRIDFIDLKYLKWRGAIHSTKEKIDSSKPRSVFLLENLRFLRGEEKNDENFAKKLASLGDFYVNDAFSVSHRADASVAAITKFLPSYAGLSFQSEIKNLNKAIKNPKRPLTIILGGSKISDKIGVVKNFLKKTDCFLVGGGVANTFIAAENLPTGDSLIEKAMMPQAREILKSKKIISPIDVKIEKRKILDIGEKTVEKYAEIIKKSKTVIWSGPMGYIENKKFRKGSEGIAKAIIKSKALAIVGGGETISLLSQTRINADISADKRGKNQLFVSTGGGAMLEYLAGKELPGIKALR